jgi:DNA primase
VIDQGTIEAVNSRTDIVEVVGHFLRLKKRGTNYIANCPFHNEKSPSFNVNPSRGIFKCFGCGKGGNAVTFLQEHEKITYPEAIKWLAEFYKLDFVESEKTPEQAQKQQAEEGLRIVAEFAAQWFADTLKQTEEGQAIGLSYFKQRGFRKEALETFRLGYCPEGGDSFYQAAVTKGYRPEVLEKLGLARQRDGRWHDIYRGRVIFPIQGLTGRVIGFGARLLKKNDRAPKYINSPESELYNKSKTLYGLYQARAAIGKLDECFLVEGYTDVISLHQAGVENVVASSGTSLTEEQLNAIGRLTRNLTILYDGDAAGVKAALRGLDMALSSGFNVQLVLLPEGEDPDSFVQGKGTAGFKDYVATHKRDVIGFRLEVGLKEAGTDPVLKSKLVNEIAESISRLTRTEDFSLRDHYLKTASSGLGVDQERFVALVNKHIRERIEGDRRQRDREQPSEPEADELVNPEPDPTAPLGPATNPDEEQEWELIKALLEHGSKPIEGATDTAALFRDRVDPGLIETPMARKLFDLYYHQLDSTGRHPELQFFTDHPDPVIRTQIASLLQKNDSVSDNWLQKFGIEILHGELRYPLEVDSSLVYFELKKLKMLQSIVVRKLSESKSSEEVMQLQAAYLAMKGQEKEMLQRTGTVIVKSRLPK